MSAPYLGDYTANTTVYFAWATNDVDGSSITRGTNGTIYVYKNLSDSTEVTTGVTDTEDFDSLTGVHSCAIATTDAFYATGKDYTVILKSAVIGGKTVNAVLAHFSIQNRYQAASGTAPSAATVAAAVWDEALAGHSTAGTAGKKLTDIPTTTYTVPTAADNADAVWDEALSGHTTAGSAGKQLQDISTGTAPTVGAIADAVWDEALSGHTTAGTAGKQLQDISTGTAPTVGAIADAVWDEALAGHLGGGSTGEALSNADTAATIIITSSPVAVEADSGTVTIGVVVSGTFADTTTDDGTYWITRPAASLSQTMTFPVGAGNFPTSVAINGYWNGSGRVVDVYALNDDTTLYDRLSNTTTQLKSRSTDLDYTYSLSRNHIDGSGVVTIKFVSTSSNTADRLRIDKATVFYVPIAAASNGSTLTPQQVWEYTPRTLTGTSGDPEPVDVGGIADAVWDEALSGHAVAGSAGQALTDSSDASSASAIADAVWDEALSGHAISGSTGEALSNAGGGGVAPTAADVADAVWDELMAGHTTPATFGMLLDAIFTSDLSDFDANAADRSMLNALRFIRNKWTTTSGVLTVMKEDDATTAWTADLTRTTGASPITSVDPV